jgi:FkbM family methyltransferase
MEVAVEAFWRRQRRAGDLTAIVSDHFVRDGATVIDVGASWGLFTYHLARRVGNKGIIYSYEPHPANAVVLERLARSGRTVEFRPVAVSDVAGCAELVVPEQHGRLVTAQSSLSHGFAGVKVQRVQVPTVRLDDDIDVASKIDFVKIDVEGHELAVLRGGSKMFRRHLPPLLIEIEQRHLTVPITDVFCELEDIGYQLFYIDDSVIRSIAQFDVQRDQTLKIKGGEFTSFSMPRDYVCNFCAVRSPELLLDFPMH